MASSGAERWRCGEIGCALTAGASAREACRGGGRGGCGQRAVEVKGLAARAARAAHGAPAGGVARRVGTRAGVAQRRARARRRCRWAVLGASGADVRIARCDVADPVAVRLVGVASDAAGPRLCGVWHVAGVLSDALLAKQTAATRRACTGRRRTVRGHCGGARLRCRSRRARSSRRWRRCWAARGRPTTRRPTAASTRWRARGGAALAGVSVQWGLWAEVGMAAGVR